MLAIQNILKKYLISQNVTSSEWNEIINPTEALENDPFLIKGSREWLNQLFNHREDVITIVGDYDADGILASATMRKGLQILNIGSKINTYVPTRMDGYGITPVSVQRIKEQFPDTQTIVTVDNGVAAFEGIQAAKDNGWTVLVTDHHLAKPDGLPVADAIVDINRPGDEYPFKGISGTAMAYKMLVAYATIISPQYLPLIQYLRTLVGISAVTDMMPMRHENRYWTKFALNEVQQDIDGIYTPHSDPHINALIKALKLKHALYSKTADESIFGFTIGPILNSPSRVTGSPQQAYDFFMTEEPDEMLIEAAKLFETNKQRKEIVGDLSNKVIDGFQQKIDNGEEIYAMATTVPLTSGFVGLIAGNLQNVFAAPSIAFSTIDFDGQILDQPDSILHGSARSPLGVSIVEIMTEMQNRDKDVILGFGGHAAAAGLTIKKDKFDDFNKLFNEVTKELMQQNVVSEDQATTNTLPSNVFVIKPEEASIALINAIDQMVPFGVEFERPQFMFEDIATTRPLLIGNIKQHIKFSIKPRIELVKWNGSSDFIHLGKPSHMSVIGELGVSEYRGNHTIQMIVNDWM